MPRDSAAASPSASAPAPAGTGRRGRPRPDCGRRAPGRAPPPPRAAASGLRPSSCGQERERRGGRVVAGEQQRDRLVSHGARVQRRVHRRRWRSAAGRARPRPGSPRRRRSSISARIARSSVRRAAIARASGVPGPGSICSRTGSPWIASDASNAAASACSRPRSPPSRAVPATRSAARARGSSGRSRPPARPQAPRRRRPPRSIIVSATACDVLPMERRAASASGSRGDRRRRCSAGRRRAAATGPRTGPRATGTRRTRSPGSGG